MFPTAQQAAARQQSAEVARPLHVATAASTPRPVEQATHRAIPFHTAATLSAEGVQLLQTAELSQAAAAVHVEAAV